MQKYSLLMADGTERLGIQRTAKGVQREEKELEASSIYTEQGPGRLASRPAMLQNSRK